MKLRFVDQNQIHEYAFEDEEYEIHIDFDQMYIIGLNGIRYEIIDIIMNGMEFLVRE